MFQQKQKKIKLFITYKKKIPPPNIVSTPFFYLAKKSPLQISLVNTSTLSI